MSIKTDFLNVSHEEKIKILSLHESYFLKNRVLENVDSSIQDFFDEFKTQLNFHKKIHSFHVSNLEINEGISYLNEIRKDYISNLFSDNQVVLENFTYKFSNIIVESTVDLLNEIEKFNNFLIESLISTVETIYEQEKAWYEKAWDKTKSVAKSAYNKAKDAVNFVVNKGLDWFMEQIRTALFSWGGAAIQAFLATSTAGVGNVILVVVWGAMLAYDLYKGIVKNDWNWVYILIDLAAILTTGPGGKIMHSLFKGLGLLGKKLPLKTVVQSAQASKSSGWFGKMINSIVKGSATIGSYMLQGISWLSSKIGLKSFSGYTNKLKTSLNTFIDDLGKAASGTTPKVLPKPTVPKPITPKKPSILSKTGATIGSALGTRPGKIATAAGIGYGFDAVTGGDTSVFSSAFVDKDAELYAALKKQKAEYDPEDLP